MHWDQHTFQLKPRARGFHLIDKEIARHLSCIAEYQIGLLNLFIQHTSASLTINENADPTVRIDMETHFNKFVPQGMSYYQHDYEQLNYASRHSLITCGFLNYDSRAGCLRL